MSSDASFLFLSYSYDTDLEIGIEITVYKLKWLLLELKLVLGFIHLEIQNIFAFIISYFSIQLYISNNELDFHQGLFILYSYKLTKDKNMCN